MQSPLVILGQAQPNYRSLSDTLIQLIHQSTLETVPLTTEEALKAIVIMHSVYAHDRFCRIPWGMIMRNLMRSYSQTHSSVKGRDRVRAKLLSHPQSYDKVVNVARFYIPLTPPPECSICIENASKMVILTQLTHLDGTSPHPDTLICTQCLHRLTKCPFCRAPL